MKLKFLIPIVLLAACSERPEPKADIYDIRAVGSLSMVEYTLGKVLEASDDAEWYKFGDRKILMSCKATVKAGINLNSLRDQDIKANGETIEITLPAPEIISFEMDPDDLRTEMVDVNGFREEFNQQEKNRILRMGEESIRKELDQLHVLQDAGRNAAKFVKDFYRRQGFTNVIVHETQIRK